MPNLLGEKTFQEVVSELQQLNPKFKITVNANGDGIICNCPVTKLHLPRDFYVTKNNCLSNRGHTASGSFVYINVEVKDADLSFHPKKIGHLKISGSLKQIMMGNNQPERNL